MSKVSVDSGSITLRKADIDDLWLLLHWDRQAHVIACDPDSDRTNTDNCHVYRLDRIL